MLGSLFSPLENRMPVPPWFLPSFLATGVITCLPPSRWRLLRIAMGAPVFAGLLLQAPKYTTGEVALDFVTGIYMSATVIKWLDFAIFHDTDREFWRLPDLRRPWRSLEEKNGAAQPLIPPHKPQQATEITWDVHPEKAATECYKKEPITNGHVEKARNSHCTEPSINGHANKSAIKGYSKEAAVTTTTSPSDEEAADSRARTLSQPVDSWFERLRWTISLWSTTRGVGWNWMVKNVPKSVPPGYPKFKFLRHTMHRFLFTYLALDFVHACTRWYTLSKGGTLPDVHAEPFPVRAAVGWLAAFETYNALQWPYYLFATITTATGICRPEQWPNLMGCFREDMWSVRQFWGKCWHTELRRTITQPAKAITKALGVPGGTKLSKYMQLYISFFISGLTHHAGAYLVGRDSGGMYGLWLGQATVIMFEDLVVHLGKKAGIKDSIYLRVLGKLWVCLWFCLPSNFPTGAAVVVNQGMGFDPPPLNFSVSAFFPFARGCSDNLFKVIANRSVILWMLSKVLSIMEADTWEDVAEAGVAAAGAVVMKLCG